MRAPMMAINTVAAGGGSILHFDGARFRVGPDSAGANPGPACYRRGGPLTVTDANVCVGKIQPRHFPAIFGPHGDQPLDASIVQREICGARRASARAAAVPRRRARDGGRASCASPSPTWPTRSSRFRWRKVTTSRDFALHCFGGAGGQHACLVADELGMDTMFIHPLAGVLSAYGMGLADQSVHAGAGSRASL